PGAPWSWDESSIYETRLGDALVTRVCERQVCGVVVGDRKPGQGLWGPDAATTLASSALTVRRDERHDLWIVSHGGALRALQGDKAPAVRVEAVAAAARPPSACIAASALGLAGALLLPASVAIRRRRSIAHAIRCGVAGVLGDDGWISFDLPIAAIR